MKNTQTAASIIMAAGRGSRMDGYDGNKTLLPLLPQGTPFKGRGTILNHILSKLPEGPKALVINYQKEAVVAATRKFRPVYIEQPRLNGTGGALLAARLFLETLSNSSVIITMGDVPLVRQETYLNLLGLLDTFDLVVLGFKPTDKRQYGVLELDGHRVRRIIEWKDWHTLPTCEQDELLICNSGIYAARTASLLECLPRLATNPHHVKKHVDGRHVELEEFFITDLVEYMNRDNLSVGYVLCEDERESMGADDLEALKSIQAAYRMMQS